MEVLLGEKLYEKICADYDADNLEDEYLILYTEYIKPFLIRQSALEYLKIGAFSVSNNGIFQPTSQNAQPISDAQLQVLKDEMSIKANAYADRMHRWLKQNNLPEYECGSENIINPTLTKLPEEVESMTFSSLQKESKSADRVKALEAQVKDFAEGRHDDHDRRVKEAEERHAALLKAHEEAVAKIREDRPIPEGDCIVFLSPEDVLARSRKCQEKL